MYRTWAKNMNVKDRLESFIVGEFDFKTDAGKVTWLAVVVLALYLAVALQPEWPSSKILAAPLIAADELGHVFGCAIVGYQVENVVVMPNGTLVGRTDFVSDKGVEWMQTQPARNAIVYIMGPLFCIALGAAAFYASALITEDPRIWSRNLWEWGFLALPGLFLMYGRLAMMLFEPTNSQSDLAQFAKWSGIPALATLAIFATWVIFVKWFTFQTDQKLKGGKP